MKFFKMRKMDKWIRKNHMVQARSTSVRAKLSATTLYSVSFAENAVCLCDRSNAKLTITSSVRKYKIEEGELIFETASGELYYLTPVQTDPRDLSRWLNIRPVCLVSYENQKGTGILGHCDILYQSDGLHFFDRRNQREIATSPVVGYQIGELDCHVWTQSGSVYQLN